MQTRDDLMNWMGALTAKVKENPSIKTPAQLRITELLDEALELLKDDDERPDPERRRNQAAGRIIMAESRIWQAQHQNKFLPILITLVTLVFMGVSAFFILQYQLWPKLGNVPLSEVFFGSVFWGMAGSAINGLRELHTRFARQEFEPTRTFWYLSHPLIGGGLGAILFLLVFGGLLSTGQTQVLPSEQGDGGFNPTLVLLLAALLGFEQGTVVIYLRETVKQVFRVQVETPEEGG